MSHKNNNSSVQSFDDQIISSIVINGDISKLSPSQKVAYYKNVCSRVGIDPMAQPFKLLRLNGKEVLYLDRGGAQQLNRLHSVSHSIKAREMVSGCYVVTAEASTPDGRKTECIGAVSVDNLKGENLSNAMMKAETKAKRRSTLDLLGLGWLDETEVDSIPNALPIDVDMETGEIKEPAPAAAGNTAKPVENGTQKPGPAVNQTNPFKKRYEDKNTIKLMLPQANSIQDVANLYYVNAEMVEADPELKNLFSEKRNQLYGKSGGNGHNTPQEATQATATAYNPSDDDDNF